MNKLNQFMADEKKSEWITTLSAMVIFFGSFTLNCPVSISIALVFIWIAGLANWHLSVKRL